MNYSPFQSSLLRTFAVHYAGAVAGTAQQRQAYAAASMAYNLKDKAFVKLFGTDIEELFPTPPTSLAALKQATEATGGTSEAKMGSGGGGAGLTGSRDIPSAVGDANVGENGKIDIPQAAVGGPVVDTAVTGGGDGDGDRATLGEAAASAPAAASHESSNAGESGDFATAASVGDAAKTKPNKSFASKIAGAFAGVIGGGSKSKK